MSDKGVLSVCATCRHAEWKKTANGRRHPDGSGRCGYEFPNSPLPKWARDRSYGRDEVSLREVLERKMTRRWIYWVDIHRDEPEPCATWEAKP